MKTPLATVILFAGLLCGRADTIAQWNFNSVPPDASSSTGATNASAGGGLLSVIGYVNYSFAAGHSSDPANSAGDNTALNLSGFPNTTNGNKTAGVRFAIDTTGYDNIKLSWWQRCSATGSRYFRLQYSVDGVHFIDAPNAFAIAYASNATPSFTNIVADLSAVPGVSNNRDFAFQIVSEFEFTAAGAGTTGYVAAATGSTYGTSGTARFEMLTVTGNVNGTPNQPPTIAAITNVTMRANTTYPPIPFTINDNETAPAALALTKSSSDLLLLPENGIVLSGAGSHRTVSLTPAANQSGAALVTLTVVDEGGKSNSTAFNVTVIPTNTPPTISVISNQFSVAEAAATTIPFVVGDLDTPAASLAVTAVSANEALLPNARISLGGSGSNRTVTLNPAVGELGHAAVTITVSDGALSTNRSFVFGVYPTAGTLLYEQFSYPNGSLRTNSSFLWRTAGGTTGELQVVDGALHVSSDASEDVAARLRGEPYAPATGTNLYYSLRFSASDLPTTLGDYFAHLKDNGTTYRAKLTIATVNAPIGYYRVGIANGASVSTNAGYAEVPTDLTFDQTNRVVVRYNVGTGVSTLWLNPSSEGSPGVTASDLIGSTNSITEFAIRETRFIGNLYVDDVRVATTFDEALGNVTAAVRLRVTRTANGLQLAWPASGATFIVETCTALNGAWQTMPGQPVLSGNGYVLDIAAPAGTAFFRLRQ